MSAFTDPIYLLKSVFLFHGLNEAQLSIVANNLVARNIETNKVFIEQDSFSDEVYIISQGAVKVYRLTEDGEEVSLAILGVGDVVGEMSLLDDEPRSANVETLQPTTLLALSKQSFREILRQYPDIALNLLAALSRRVRITNEHLESVLLLKLEERTWQILEVLAKHFNNQEIHLSQEEVASLVGATRARVSEVLNYLEKKGRIKLSHRSIQVCKKP